MKNFSSSMHALDSCEVVCMSTQYCACDKADVMEEVKMCCFQLYGRFIIHTHKEKQYL